MKIGMVLEGGAKRGIYTAGVLDVLGEHGIYPDGVIGVSAGAIHGCSYVAGQNGRSIRYNLKYGNDYRFMSLRSWLKSGNVVDVDFCYHQLPENLDKFDNDAFKASSTAFYVVCSNVETGEPEYIRCRDLATEIDFLRASASLPFLSKIVEAGNKKLLDGGTTDSIPLKAFENMGYEKKIVILTRPQGYRKKAAYNGWLAKMVYHGYAKFAEVIRNRHLMYNRELAYVEERKQAGKAFVIRPSRKATIGKMERNPEKVLEMYALGRQDAEAALPGLKAFAAGESVSQKA